MEKYSYLLFMCFSLKLILKCLLLEDTITRKIFLSIKIFPVSDVLLRQPGKRSVHLWSKFTVESTVKPS